MPIPFSGPARPLAPSDIARAAQALGCDMAAVQAVLTVETGGAGGFLTDGSGRPRILFEAHLFSRATAGRWDASHPGISAPSWNRSLYRGGAAEYLRLEEAAALDRRAALESASWGLFQILGSNHRAAGMDSAETMAFEMAQSEAAHLDAFIAFCRTINVAWCLRDRDWTTFARRYNGPAYAVNAYDTKLARAYEKARGGTPTITGATVPRLLDIGDRGDDVRRLQAALNARGADLGEDGIFGRVTELAVMRFQQDLGLAVDGIAGPKTRAALGV